MNWGLEISEHQCLDTDLNRLRDFAGSRTSIASIISGGRFFIADIYHSGGEATRFFRVDGRVFGIVLAKNTFGLY